MQSLEKRKEEHNCLGYVLGQFVKLVTRTVKHVDHRGDGSYAESVDRESKNADSWERVRESRHWPQRRHTLEAASYKELHRAVRESRL